MIDDRPVPAPRSSTRPVPERRKAAVGSGGTWLMPKKCTSMATLPAQSDKTPSRTITQS